MDIFSEIISSITKEDDDLQIKNKLLFIASLIAPSFLIFFLFKRDMFIDLDTTKLIIICLIINLTMYIITNFIVSFQVVLKESLKIYYFKILKQQILIDETNNFQKEIMKNNNNNKEIEVIYKNLLEISIFLKDTSFIIDKYIYQKTIDFLNTNLEDLERSNLNVNKKNKLKKVISKYVNFLEKNKKLINFNDSKKQQNDIILYTNIHIFIFNIVCPIIIYYKNITDKLNVIISFIFIFTVLSNVLDLIPITIKIIIVKFKNIFK